MRTVASARSFSRPSVSRHEITPTTKTKPVARASSHHPIAMTPASGTLTPPPAGRPRAAAALPRARRSADAARARPRRRARRTREIASATCSALASSRLASGSSSSRTSGVVSSTRSKATRAACPTERRAASRSSAMSERWTLARAESSCEPVGAGCPCRILSVQGSSRFSPTVPGRMVAFCGSRATLDRHSDDAICSAGTSRSASRPLCWGSRRASDLSSIVLPAPEGPMTSTISPTSKREGRAIEDAHGRVVARQIDDEVLGSEQHGHLARSGG